MFNQADQFTLIPPAWSLGAEIQFYLVIPFVLLIRDARVLYAVLGVSVTIFLLASFGSINSDWYAYRLLPGVLFMFLLGACLYELHEDRGRRARARMLVAGVISIATIVGILLDVTGKLAMPYDRETLIGLIIGITAVNILGHRRRRVVDDMIGNLSYGVFLNHYLVMWTFFNGHVGGLANVLAYLGTSVCIAFVMYGVVERPVLVFRRAVRKAASAGSIVLSPAARGG
jgi:peptidoglycan/LPS O-acetylase OafA/YrhL